MPIEVDLFKSIDLVTDKKFNSTPLVESAARRIVVQKDIVYDAALPKTCVMDTYHIPERGKKYPVLIYIHGGGFVAGDKSYRRGVCKWYAQRGIYVFNLNYGLCPAFRYPEPLAHLVKAFNFIVDHAKRMSLDLSKVLVSGDSAGAYYATMLIGATRDARLQQTLGVAPKGSIGAAVLNCGLYDIRSVMEARMLFDINKRIFASFTGQKKVRFEDYDLKEVCSPTEYITADYPPCFVIYSKKDLFCAGQSERLIERLTQAGASFESFESDALLENHCFPLNWKGNRATEANRRTVAFVNNFINGK